MSLPNTTPTTWNIYFVRRTESSKIMIAKTRRDPDVALKQLAIPEKCVFIKSILGTSNLREQLHEEFISLSIPESKNWYIPNQELTTRIETIEDYDGEEPPPLPPPYKPKKYIDPYFYCCRCNSQEEDDSILLQVDDDYVDWGDVHRYGVLQGQHLCRTCAFQGGLTNSVFDHFLNNREKLHPFWNESDEFFFIYVSMMPKLMRKVDLFDTCLAISLLRIQTPILTPLGPGS